MSYTIHISQTNIGKVTFKTIDEVKDWFYGPDALKHLMVEWHDTIDRDTEVIDNSTGKIINITELAEPDNQLNEGE